MMLQANGLSSALKFFRFHFLAIAAISTALVIPCVWHRRIEAGDLASHTYNAWLAQLIEQGKAPGLYTVGQHTNVLFDFLLLQASKIFGFIAGPKIVVAMCALVFFWGVFSLVTATSGRAPWFLAPVIAMLTYGYTFNMGFFNYYLSIGLASFGLALFWQAKKWDWLAGALIFCLAVVAHPIGSLWCLATCTYVLVRRRVPGFWGLAVPVAAIATFIALHSYLAHAASLGNAEINWLDRPFYFYNGLDQFVVYSARCKWFVSALLTITGAWVAYEALEWREYAPVRNRFFLWVELYFLSFIVICLLPQDLRLDPTGSWMGLLVSRLTIIAAIFALCALSFLKPRILASAALATCAAFYFAFLYQDTAAVNRLEWNAQQMTNRLPFGTLVIPTIEPRSTRIPYIGHVVDRACIGYCFTYSNYEPSSRQFRLRVRQGSPVATASNVDSQNMEGGGYVVRPGDPPFINVYQCNPDDFTVLCMRQLAVGDQTGAAADPDN
jgi:hypothetical protein